MRLKIVPEKGIFLNEEQKKLKQQIMKKLLETLFDSIADSAVTLNEQNASDLITSILIMFNRESLCHYFKTFDAIPLSHTIMDLIFEEIKSQVKMQLNNHTSQ